MTLRTSLANKGQLLNFILFTLKKQTPMTLLVTAFALLVCPGTLLRDANDDLIRDYNLGAWEFATYSALILGAAIALVCMLLLLNFGFLFSKKAGDLYGALPFTRNQLLLARGVSAFVGGLFLMTVSYAGLIIVNFLPTVDGVSALTAITTYLFMLLSLIVLTAFCLLFGICSGGYFDVVIAFLAINIAPVLIVALVLGVAEESAIGLAFDYSILVYLTPVAYVFFKLINIPVAIEKENVFLSNIEKTTVFTVIGLILFGALLIFAAVKLFKIRKSETAGEAYSFKFMPVTITILVSIVGGFIMAGVLTGFILNFTVTFWFFFVVCAILCAIAIGAIMGRSFKNVKRSVIYGLISAALMTATVISGLFVADYAENRVPDAEKIQTVYVGYSEYKENIDLALKLHKGIVESLNEEEREDGYVGEYPGVINNFGNFDFKYVMKNGNVIKRNYWYRSPNMEKLHDEILALMQCNSFFEQYKDSTKATYKYINVNAHSAKFGGLEEGEEVKSAVLTEKEAEKLIALFKKEMQAADMSIFSEKVYGISVSGDEWSELYIPESFTETINFLEERFIKQAAED